MDRSLSTFTTIGDTKHHDGKDGTPSLASRRPHPPRPHHPATHIQRLHPLRPEPLRQTPPLGCNNPEQQPPLRQDRPGTPNGRRAHIRRTGILHPQIPRPAEYMGYSYGAIASRVAA